MDPRERERAWGYGAQPTGTMLAHAVAQSSQVAPVSSAHRPWLVEDGASSDGRADSLSQGHRLDSAVVT